LTNVLANTKLPEKLRAVAEAKLAGVA